MAAKNTVCQVFMSKTSVKTCSLCGASPLDRDTIGINKKLMAKGSPILCMKCLAERLDVTVQDLLDKIEDFREDGCTLFT